MSNDRPICLYRLWTILFCCMYTLAMLLANSPPDIALKNFTVVLEPNSTVIQEWKVSPSGYSLYWLSSCIFRYGGRLT